MSQAILTNEDQAPSQVYRFQKFSTGPWKTLWKSPIALL